MELPQSLSTRTNATSVASFPSFAKIDLCRRSGICHGSGPDQPPCLANLDENAEAVFYQLLRIGMYYDVLIGDDPFKNVTAEADGGRSEVAR